MNKIKDGKIKAVIFDLDGVIVTTDECHYEAWKRMADEEGIYFDHSINERLRGVSRMESLNIILERSSKSYDEQQKFAMAERKNDYYKELIKRLTPEDILPGVENFISVLKEKGVKIAIGSSSKNTPIILERIGLNNTFDAVIDGNSIKMSKPDPEVFFKVAQQLEISAEYCLVVEDADAGIEAAVSAGMKVLAVGAAAANNLATLGVDNLLEVSVILFN